MKLIFTACLGMLMGCQHTPPIVETSSRPEVAVASVSHSPLNALMAIAPLYVYKITGEPSWRYDERLEKFAEECSSESNPIKAFPHGKYLMHQSLHRHIATLPYTTRGEIWKKYQERETRRWHILGVPHKYLQKTQSCYHPPSGTIIVGLRDFKELKGEKFPAHAATNFMQQFGVQLAAERIIPTPTSPPPVNFHSNCENCGDHLNATLETLAHKEIELRSREAKIQELFTPYSPNGKHDPFDPDYQNYLRQRSATLAFENLRGVQRADSIALHTLQQENHFLSGDPSFAEELYNIRLAYKKLHDKAEKKLKEEHKNLKQNNLLLKKEEQQNQKKLKQLTKKPNPLKTVKSRAILRGRVKKQFKVPAPDPFESELSRKREILLMDTIPWQFRYAPSK
jgi:hypothetical protein